MSADDIKVVAYALVGAIVAVLIADRIGALLVADYETTESTIIGIMVGGVTALAIGRSFWPGR